MDVLIAIHCHLISFAMHMPTADRMGIHMHYIYTSMQLCVHTKVMHIYVHILLPPRHHDSGRSRMQAEADGFHKNLLCPFC